MIALPAIVELFNYNYWARDRQLEASAAVSDSDFVRPLGGSFPSLRDTFAHMLVVEWVWLERWQGRNPRTAPPLELPDVAAVSARWREVEGNMRSYLAGLTPETLERPQTYINTRGIEWTYPLWRMLMHLIMHQGYHRGQVTSQLRMLGIQPPEVDFLPLYGAGLGKAR
jgi:uncharacterized damage-inducible protein DinB